MARAGPQASAVVPDTVLSTASQTCTSWDAATELELASCKEDLRGWDAETIFRASTRIAKVTSQGACVGIWAGGPGPTSSLGGRALLSLAA